MISKYSDFVQGILENRFERGYHEGGKIAKNKNQGKVIKTSMLYFPPGLVT